LGIYQGNDFRKITGGRRRPHRNVRKYELGRFPTLTIVADEEKRQKIRTRGGNTKVRAMKVTYASLVDPRTGKSKRVRIVKVAETPANREYARRNIVVRGAIIETEEGLAKVTSRPGQNGVINAVLISPKESGK